MQRSAISLPLVLVSGENSSFEKLMAGFAEALRDHGCANVKSEVIKNSVHYVADEQPEAVAQLIVIMTTMASTLCGSTRRI